MASPAVFPVKGAALRINFAIRDVTGSLVKGWTSPSALIVKDDGAAASSTNTPAEHATNNGTGYLDLTASEMNAKSVVVVVSVTNANAKEAVVVIDTDGLAEIIAEVQANPWPDAGDTLDISHADGQVSMTMRYLKNAHIIDRVTGIHYILKDDVAVSDILNADGTPILPRVDDGTGLMVLDIDPGMVMVQGVDLLTRDIAAIGAKEDPSA